MCTRRNIETLTLFEMKFVTLEKRAKLIYKEGSHLRIIYYLKRTIQLMVNYCPPNRFISLYTSVATTQRSEYKVRYPLLFPVLSFNCRQSPKR